MSAERPPPDGIRISVTVAREHKDRLDAMAQKVSPPDLPTLFRTSLAIFEFLDEHIRSGGTIMLESKDGKRTQLTL